MVLLLGAASFVGSCTEFDLGFSASRGLVLPAASAQRQLCAEVVQQAALAGFSMVILFFSLFASPRIRLATLAQS